jgi:hypothetical protein
MWVTGVQTCALPIAVGSSFAVGIFLYVAQTIERVLAVALGTNYAGSSLAGGIFLYVAQVVYRVTGVSF